MTKKNFSYITLFLLPFLFSNALCQDAANTDQSDNQKETSTIQEQLIDAAQNCDHQQLDILLEQCDPQDSTMQQALLKLTTEVIRNCTKHNNGPNLIRALAKNKRIDFSQPIQDEDGYTTLFLASSEAAKTGAKELLEELLKCEADPLSLNQLGDGTYSTLEMHEQKLPEHLKMFPHNDSVIALLKKYVLEKYPDYAPAEKVKQERPLTQQEQLILKEVYKQPRKAQKQLALEACATCNQQVLKVVLQWLNEEQDFEFEQELLDAAISCSHMPEILDELAKFGVNFNSPSRPMQPLLSVALTAAHNGDMEMLKKMLKLGANPSVENKQNGEIIGTTLHIFKGETKSLPKKFPHADKVLVLLERAHDNSTSDKTSFIAPETNNVFFRIWNRI